MNNIIKKIIAFFKFGGEERTVEVSSAEIKENIVYLHPVEDDSQTICIKAETVGITINPEGVVEEGDIFLVENTYSQGVKNDSQTQELSQMPILPNQNEGQLQGKSTKKADIQGQSSTTSKKSSKNTKKSLSSQSVTAYLKEIGVPTVKRVSFDFFEDDYIDFIDAYKEFSKNIELKGGNRTEFILACTKAAKKTSMESLYKKYHSKHKEIREKEREARKKAEEELKNAISEEKAS